MPQYWEAVVFRYNNRVFDTIMHNLLKKNKCLEGPRWQPSLGPFWHTSKVSFCEKNVLQIVSNNLGNVTIEMLSLGGIILMTLGQYHYKIWLVMASHYIIWISVISLLESMLLAITWSLQWIKVCELADIYWQPGWDQPTGRKRKANLPPCCKWSLCHWEPLSLC